ncbi:MAG: DUF421 domain-containing protein [Actinobacteria bacterium]|nr:DUF421 domain-containing protein [Actinomycetota bacterium]
MSDWFGSSWATVAYVAASTTAVYCSALLAIRLAGRRTVAQLSAFDIVVTIALGSLIASTAVSRDPSYAQGTTAMITLLILQVVAAGLRQRFAIVRRFLDFAPWIVVRDGELQLPNTPLGPQMSADELLSKLRERGVFDLEGVRLVVIEPTGGVAVLRDGDEDPPNLDARPTSG